MNQLMKLKIKKFLSGISLVEVIIAMTVATVLVLVVGIILAGGQQAWHRTYDSANKQIKTEAEAVTVAFGSMGRRSNRLSYTIYNESSGNFTPALPQTSDPQETVYGDAVEFKYWDVELESGDPHGLMDPEKIATAYALFYIDQGMLKVDYGSVDSAGIGAVPSGGGSRNTSNIYTVILAENVTPGSFGTFSHTTIAGTGQGSVKIDVTLNDPDDNEKIRIMTGTLLRNVWP